MTFYDDYSSHAWILLLQAKSDALMALERFCAFEEKQFSNTIKRIRTDNGGEYVSKQFEEFLRSKGIVHETSAPHIHQQNGRAERLNRTFQEKAQAMRLTVCLPDSWWEFALNTAVHCYNRTPIKRLEWKTPMEMATGKKPDLSGLHVFGCAAYVFIPKESCDDKLSPRSELMIFLGYAGANYNFMRHQKGNIIYTAKTAIFDEGWYPKCKPDHEKRKDSGSTKNPKINPPPPASDEDDEDITPDLYPDDPMDTSRQDDSERLPPRPQGPIPGPSTSQKKPPVPGPSKPAPRKVTVEEVPDEDDDALSYADPESPVRHPSPSPAPPADSTRPISPSPERPAQPVEPLPRRSGRERFVPFREGNAYGERTHPSEILRDYNHNEPLPPQGRVRLRGHDFRIRNQ